MQQKTTYYHTSFSADNKCGENPDVQVSSSRLTTLVRNWNAFGAATAVESASSEINHGICVFPGFSSAEEGKHDHCRDELHRYLDNQGRSGESFRAKVTSSLG